MSLIHWCEETCSVILTSSQAIAIATNLRMYATAEVMRQERLLRTFRELFVGAA